MKLIIFLLFFCISVTTIKAQSKTQTTSLIGHNSQITTFCASIDKKYLITASYVEKKIIIWDLNSNKQLTTIDDFKSGINEILMHPSGNYFIVSCNDGSMIAFDFPSLKTKWIQMKDINPEIKFLCNGKYLTINGKFTETETGLDLKDKKNFSYSYLIDDSTFVKHNKNGDDIIDAKTFEKIITVKNIPFKENKNSIINNILYFNRNDYSCLYVVDEILCYDFKDIVKYSVSGDYEKSLINESIDYLRLATDGKNNFTLFNVENGKILAQKKINAIFSHDYILSGLSKISPDGKYVILGNKIVKWVTLELVDIFLDSKQGYYFLTNNEILSVGLFPQKIKLLEKNGVLIDANSESIDEFLKN
jgi:WD40 repeat protein